MPDEVFLITTDFLDQPVLAVATDKQVAQAYADRWTRDSEGTIAAGSGPKAVVGERVPFVTEAPR